MGSLVVQGIDVGPKREKKKGKEGVAGMRVKKNSNSLINAPRKVRRVGYCHSLE